MSQCPSCSASVAEDFGLITCSNCGEQLFVEMDGSVRMNSAVDAQNLPAQESAAPDGFMAELPETQEEPMATHSIAIEELGDLNNLSVKQEEPQEPTQVLDSQGSSEPTNEFEEPENFELQNENEEPVSFEVQEPNDMSVDDEFAQQEGYEEPPQFTSSEPENSAAPAGSPLQEISDYGNSEVSGGSSGNYLYNLTIEGIDSKEIRQALKDALFDPKFQWNENELMNSIENGRLEIKEVNPVKSFVLLKRLVALPLNIKWEQHDIVG